MRFSCFSLRNLCVSASLRGFLSGLKDMVLDRRPPWLKVKLPSGGNFLDVLRLVDKQHLHTVCQSAHCPNIGECWNRRTATFMILGNICTRNCGFCAVDSGKPEALDKDEPRRVAEAVNHLGLRYAVITSVTRDDLLDGGAEIFADTIREIRQHQPGCKIEVLIPDFQGDQKALDIVFQEKPDVLNHNLETVKRLYPLARPQADYGRSLSVLKMAAQTGLITKSGLMLGLGETDTEIKQSIHDFVAAGCRILTLGQYLQPTKKHLPIDRYVHPDEFETLRKYGLSAGLTHVEAGPLVRSSYHADEQAKVVSAQPAKM